MLYAYPLGHRVPATLKIREKSTEGLVETQARCARGAPHSACGAFGSLTSPQKAYPIRTTALQPCQIAAASLFGATLCYGTGQYKMTLDMAKGSELRQIKGICLFQLMVVIITRVWVWFTALYLTMWKLYDDGDTLFISCGVVVGLLFTIFNLALVKDGIQAVVKWVVTSPATSQEKDRMVDDLARVDAALQSPVGSPRAASMKSAVNMKSRFKFAPKSE